MKKMDLVILFLLISYILCDDCPATGYEGCGECELFGAEPVCSACEFDDIQTFGVSGKKCCFFVIENCLKIDDLNGCVEKCASCLLGYMVGFDGTCIEGSLNGCKISLTAQECYLCQNTDRDVVLKNNFVSLYECTTKIGDKLNGCRVASSKEENCIECLSTDYFLFEGQCYGKTGDLEYCKKASSPNTCTECETGDYLMINNKCYLRTTNIDENCLEVIKDPTDPTENKCSKCKTNLLLIGGGCYGKPGSLAHCAAASSVSSCDNCDNGFVKTTSGCEEPSTPELQHCARASGTACEVCEKGYVVCNNKCEPTSLEHCITATSSCSKCETCEENFEVRNGFCYDTIVTLEITFEFI